MSVRREDTATKSDEPQAGSFWIPVTPAKHDSTDRQLICTNLGKHETLPANWLETEILVPTNPVDQAIPTGPGGFVQEPQCQSTPTFYTSTSLNNASRGIENWHAGIATNSHVFGKDSSTYDKFSYGNLLQAMNITSSSGFHPQFEGSLFEVPVALTDFISGSGISTPYFDPQVGSTMSTGNSFPRDQCTILGADFDATVRMPNTVTDRSPIHSRHFDLNVPPGTITDAVSRKSSPIQFEPITPEKTKRAEYSQESEMKHSSIDGVPTRKKNKTTGSGVMQLHENKEKSLLVNDQLCEVTSRQLQENHKPDNGTVEPDLVKTPQQKTRRKKHRPKVIIEGRKKNTPIASTERKSVPQGTPRVKRKYTGKDGVNSSSGGKKNGTDSENKTPSPTETPVGKRNSRRSQGLGKPEDTDNETIETTEIQEPRYTRRSCRRSLKFNTDDLVIDEISSDCPPSSCEPFQEENLKAKDHPETEPCTQEMEVMMNKKDMVNSRVCTHSMNKLLEESMSRDEQHPQSSLPSINKNTEKESHMLIDQTACTRGKSPIVFSEKPDEQWIPKSPCDSMGSSTCLTPEKQIRGLKIQNTDNCAEAELCSRNETGILYNSLQAYVTVFTQNADNGIPGLHFPVIFKKKRTEKVYSTVTSSVQIKPHLNNGVEFEGHTPAHSCRNLFTSPTNQGSCADQSQATNLLTTKHATGGPQNGRQVIEDLLALGPIQRIKRKRSKGPTRQRNLASLLENCKPWPQSPVRVAAFSRTEHNIELLNKKLSCIEALVADSRAQVATKKRSKRSMPIKARVQNGCNHQILPGTSLGRPLELTWKSMTPVDSITDKLNRLDLNADSKASEDKYNTFMRCHNYYKEHYALVPFQDSGAVVPFDQVRSKKPRPKVDLDDETTRVWRLLLENINSEGIDGTNDENTKWWEEERRVFIGRANSFIARMHLVQGDRHFSPWKGSVVDSVVGVFLTQNVSDHLSSSAFMSLAARFPAKPSIQSTELDDERMGGEIREPEVFELNSDGTFVLMKEIVNETVCGEDTKALQEFEDDSSREMNSMKPCQNAYEDDSILEGQSPDPPLGPVISCEIMANKVTSLNGDGKDKEDTLSSQTPEISSQNSADSPIAETTRKSNSSEEEPTVGDKPNWLTGSAFVVKLLQMTETVLHGVHGEGNDNRKSNERQYAPPSESSACSLHNEDHLDNPAVPVKNIGSCQQSSLGCVPNLGAQITDFNLLQKNSKFLDSSSDKELCTYEMSHLSSESVSGRIFQKSAISLGVEKIPSSIVRSSSYEQVEINQIKVDNQRGQAPEPSKTHGASEKTTYQQNLMDATCSTSNIDNSKYSEHKEVNFNKSDLDYHPEKTVNGPKSKGGRTSKEKENLVDWDQLRKQAHFGGKKRERTERTLDSVDWDAIRCADVHEIAQTIKERGMNNKLAERIKDFLDRIVRDHGSIDLEWLRDVPPDKAKEYLLSIRGLGLKSVECVRLLTLHHLAFPVDTNVGRIAVRLGWVPLQPLPESLQLHLLELYPVLESIQKYLWPRLCKLDQKTLYELHYQMITFGKVFCTKNRPNCNACPMRGECRHFASAYASARLALPAPQDKSIISATENRRARQNPIKSTDTLKLPSPPTDGLDRKSGVQLKIENSKAGQNPVKSMDTLQLSSPQTDGLDPKSGVSNYLPIIEEPQSPEPIVEEPATPEPDYKQAPECDIGSALSEDPDEIPTIHLNIEEFTHNLQMIMQHNTELQEGEMSKALVALTSEAASIPVPKLKNVGRLRTEHHVYELPDSHPLLEGMDKREPDDPCPYLLAIWTPGETMDSIEPPEKRCSSLELEKLCTDETCLSCNSIREAKFQTVRGTLLIPCRTAMRGSFPLNGTYFQVNEVFSDHESSLSPMDIPRRLLWNLPRRTVYFGTSIPTIFKGLSTEGIQHCFWRGFVCVRGFDRKTRAPRPLIARLHFPASKLAKGKGKVDEN